MKRFRNKLVLAVVLVLIVALVGIGATAMAAARGEWQPNTYYVRGDTVTYQGAAYACRQSHTSLVGWEPPNVPALWLPQGTATTPPPTTPPPTTPPPTIPPPTTPPPTSPPGACTAPAWNATTVYRNGDVVSHNGHEWRAQWWTRGEEPGTTGQWGVWVDLGACGTTPPPTTPPPTTPPPTNPPPTTPPPTNPPPSGTIILGYFAQWGVYARNYHVKNIVTSGSASKLTHINYAFGNVQNGQCVIGDAYADYDRFYDAATSVDGVADTWDAGALRGSFNQLRKLKQMYPHIKILWSFGGWTWSGGFTQAAANPTAFANSCYNLLHDARWNGVFDGIDIDWEYPNSCGLTCDSSGSAAYRTLMSALRSRFGSELVTAAVPAGYSHINAADYGGASQYVNWYNVMTYDFFGAFAPTGPTAPHSPLTSYSGIPQANFYSDYAIQLYKQKGVPSNKLLLGVGFYGRGWTGVTQTAPGGSATGPAPGTYEQGIEDYKVLVNTCPATSTIAGTAYARCGSNWWSYDTPSTLAGKMTYKKNQGLGGTFFWELSGDTANGSLITALYNNR